MNNSQRKILLLDIGGVLLSDGWGHESREKAADVFGIDHTEMSATHNLLFSLYEAGKITLDDYLDTVVFNQPRDFSKVQFKEFMFSQSVELTDMLSWLKEWKRRSGNVRVIAVNNEGRELNQHRIKTFGLHDVFDAFVSSCEVGLTKPDPAIWRLAMSIAQVKPERCLYFDDRLLMAQAAKRLGIQAYQHQTVQETHAILEDWVQQR
ncbi:HAD family hydrolase [Spirosoma foliorum]|uniref:HAD-IA family hydrolase n=1 Tax=Spirosoma foliorum TaxID=2710596 RepID=A0A7G5GPC7_9BACT|nr:HAD-IA family hydrolase [Spirosoma foliorum]QMW00719.1 HAD-IA family hydrolase [Spirosoma foliorum]